MGFYQSPLKRLIFQLHRYSLAHLMSGDYAKAYHFPLRKTKTLLFDYPRHLLVEPTLKCNIRCPLCPSPMRLNPRRTIYDTMDYKTFEKVVDNCRDVTYRMYLTHTGEPLLNRDLHRMIGLLTRVGIMSMISTNATLLDEEHCRRLITAGLDYLIISFDGFSKESFESFRKGASFEKTLANIEMMNRIKLDKRSLKPYIDIQWIRNRLNEGEIPAAVKYFSRLKGVNEFHVKSLSLNEHILSDEEVKAYTQTFLPKQGKVRNQYAKGGGSISSSRPCAAVYSPVVLANGDVTVCCMDFKGEYVVGNIAREKFSRLWKSGHYRSIRKKARACGLPICVRCPIRYG